MGNYEIYREMYDAIPELERKIREHFSDRTVYSVFLSVADEFTREYFVDVEVGGSSEMYKRIRGTYTVEELAPILTSK